MQPTYLPWAGYFNLIANVDQFVFLDDVQFERQSWQCKNRILLGGQATTLMVPVRKAPLSTRIQDVAVDDAKGWRARHAQALTDAYGAAPRGPWVLEAITPLIVGTAVQQLSTLNVRLIRALCELLGLRPRFHLASELACEGRRSEHVALICERIGEQAYLSPAGAREYLEADSFAAQYGKQVRYQSFEPATYAQGGTPAFVSHLSIVDLLAWHGPEVARAYVGVSP
jgi:hypothetical protein